MSLLAILILGLVVVPTLGLAVIGWLALDEEAQELRSFVGFDGMHMEN